MITDESAFPTTIDSKADQDSIASLNSTTHVLKCWPVFFQAIFDGRKTHDLRRSDDRNFNVGDLIQLREFDPKSERYSGRTLTVEVTYLTSADAPCALSARALDRDFCILSIKKLM